MIRIIGSICFLLLSTYSLAGDVYKEYKWGTGYVRIQSEHNIHPLENKALQHNLENYFTTEFYHDISQYYEPDRPVSISGYNFKKGYGFYKNKLIYTFIFTDELSLPENFALSNLTDYKSILLPIVPGSYGVIIKKRPLSGNIFLESAITFHAITDDSIVEMHISTGLLSKPKYLQFIIFEFDKKFFENLTQSNNYTVNPIVKQQFPSNRMFTKYMSTIDIQAITNKSNN